MTDVGRALRVLRATDGLTQKAVADAAGLSAAYVSQIESGHKEPALDVLRRLAEAVGTDLSTLFRLADAPGEELAAASLAQAPSMSATATVAPASEVAVHADEAPITAASIPSREPAAGAGSGRVLPSRRSSRHFGRSRQNAEDVLRSSHAIRDVTTSARALLERPEAARLGDVREDLQVLVELLVAYGHGTHRAVAWESLVLIAAALLYFVSPEDVVPDYLDEGYLDDAAVIAFVSEMVAPDLDAFVEATTA